MTKNEMFKLSKDERKLVSKMFWRNQYLMFCTSYTKQQGITYGWLMAPFLQKIYGKDTDDFYVAMGRLQYSTSNEWFHRCIECFDGRR